MLLERKKTERAMETQLEAMKEEADAREKKAYSD